MYARTKFTESGETITESREQIEEIWREQDPVEPEVQYAKLQGMADLNMIEVG